LAVVTFTSEFVLKTAFTEDVLEITELKREIYNAGVLQIGEESAFSWSEFAASSRMFTAISLRPTWWVSRVWPHVLSLAKQMPCRIDVLSVDPESPAARDTAMRLVWGSKIGDVSLTCGFRLRVRTRWSVLPALAGA
jgi:hypothetical protein